MRQNRKVNYWVIGIALVVLTIIGYFSYKDVQYARCNGVYTMATIYKLRPARNGWKVKTVIIYQGHEVEFDHLEEWEVFSINEKEKRFFAKINTEGTTVNLGFIYTREEVPDSIRSAPFEGWTEEWMKAHYPQVVEYVHDTR